MWELHWLILEGPSVHILNTIKKNKNQTLRYCYCVLGFVLWILYVSIPVTSKPPCEGSAVIIYFLRINKWRHREVKWLPWGQNFNSCGPSRNCIAVTSCLGDKCIEYACITCKGGPFQECCPMWGGLPASPVATVPVPYRTLYQWSRSIPLPSSLSPEHNKREDS